MTSDLRSELYPEIEPYETGRLKVSDIHELYYEEVGNKAGNPVIYLHGGPGGGSGPRDRQFFDPSAYRVILMDQRGAGKSTPCAELEENTTWDLVADIEKIREHLHIDKWVVFGGSWGSTLSLVYAETYPERVKALILRGIFTGRRQEIQWLYQGGASRLFPDNYAELLDLIPPDERNDIVTAYHIRLTSPNEDVRKKFARTWSKYELNMCQMHIDKDITMREDEDQWWLQFARIESHYFYNCCFLKSDSQILDNVDRIRHIPGTIVHGRYDVVCPLETAWELHKKWPEAELFIVPDAGHSAREPGTVARLVQATERYKMLT